MVQQGRNYSRLANDFPIDAIDPYVVFDEQTHRYTVRGELVPRSATKVVSDALREQPFNADAIILKNMASWRAKPRSKSGAMIRGLSDDAAAAKIRNLWDNANVLGTTLHRRLEAALNARYRIRGLAMKTLRLLAFCLKFSQGDGMAVVDQGVDLLTARH